MDTLRGGEISLSRSHSCYSDAPGSSESQCLPHAHHAQDSEGASLEENATSFIKVCYTLWKFVIGVLAMMEMSDSLPLPGLTAGFFGMMLGWSLQQPVTGVTGWMIIFKKPFRIGDC